MTTQVPEKIILNGIEKELDNEPTIPRYHEHIEVHDNASVCTACWRRYVGTWEVEDNKLYLKDITNKYKLTCSTPLFADWYTGVLIVPENSIYGFYGAEYSKSQIITVVLGNVVKIEYADNSLLDHVSSWSKPKINQLFGAICYESTEFFAFPNADNKDALLLIFQFNNKDVVEKYIGKFIIAIQEHYLPIEITTASAEPNRINGDEYFSIVLSVAIHWAQELISLFGIERKHDAAELPNATKGIWRFNKEQSLIDVNARNKAIKDNHFFDDEE